MVQHLLHGRLKAGLHGVAAELHCAAGVNHERMWDAGDPCCLHQLLSDLALRVHRHLSREHMARWTGVLRADAVGCLFLRQATVMAACAS